MGQAATARVLLACVPVARASGGPLAWALRPAVKSRGLPPVRSLKSRFRCDWSK